VRAGATGRGSQGRGGAHMRRGVSQNSAVGGRVREPLGTSVLHPDVSAVLSSGRAGSLMSPPSLRSLSALPSKTVACSMACLSTKLHRAQRKPQLCVSALANWLVPCDGAAWLRTRMPFAEPSRERQPVPVQMRNVPLCSIGGPVFAECDRSTMTSQLSAVSRQLWITLERSRRAAVRV
jgi:hypothetical protein